MSHPKSDAAVVAWMKGHGWKVGPGRREVDPDLVFYVWQEDEPQLGRSHALWIDEAMLEDLSPEQLVGGNVQVQSGAAGFHSHNSTIEGSVHSPGPIVFDVRILDSRVGGQRGHPADPERQCGSHLRQRHRG